MGTTTEGLVKRMAQWLNGSKTKYSLDSHMVMSHENLEVREIRKTLSVDMVVILNAPAEVPQELLALFNV